MLLQSVELKSLASGPSSLHFPRSLGLLAILTWLCILKTVLQGPPVTTQVWSTTSWNITWTPSSFYKTDDRNPHTTTPPQPNNTTPASTISSHRTRSSDPVPNLG